MNCLLYNNLTGEGCSIYKFITVNNKTFYKRVLLMRNSWLIPKHLLSLQSIKNGEQMSEEEKEYEVVEAEVVEEKPVEQPSVEEGKTPKKSPIKMPSISLPKVSKERIVKTLTDREVMMETLHDETLEPHIHLAILLFLVFIISIIISLLISV